jgi:hypothetical protein
MGRVGHTLAVAATAAFAGDALLSQTVVVPQWRAMAPAEFLREFATQGPVTGATVFPFELASVVLLGFATVSAVRGRESGRAAWALAFAAMLGSVALLAAYFVRADLALLDPAFPRSAVSGTLAVWSRWNWVRAGLGIIAAVLACVAVTRQRDDARDRASSRAVTNNFLA